MKRDNTRNPENIKAGDTVEILDGFYKGCKAKVIDTVQHISGSIYVIHDLHHDPYWISSVRKVEDK